MSEIIIKNDCPALNRLKARKIFILRSKIVGIGSQTDLKRPLGLTNDTGSSKMSPNYIFSQFHTLYQSEILAHYSQDQIHQ